MKRFVAILLVGLLAASACGSRQASGDTTTSIPQTAMTAAPLLTVQEKTLPKVQATFVESLVHNYQSVLAKIERHDFVGGVWHPLASVWQTGLELADVAAIVSRETGSTRDRDLAVKSLNTAIGKHQLSNGAFGGDSPGYTLDQASQFATGSALVSLGTAYLELSPLLSEPQKAAWQLSLKRAADWLTQDIHFYVNGNINLQGALGLYLAWRATKDRRLYAAYNSAWRFALDPGKKWPGRGLEYTKTSTKRFGLGGAAYLTEQGAGAPGFDPHYTTLQSDYVAELYAVCHAQRALRLLNLLEDQLFTRIDPSTLFLETGGGSRDSRPSQNEFISASLPVLAFSLRHDLLAYVPKQEGIAEIYFTYWAKTGMDQDQIVGNYAMSILALQPGIAG